MFVHLFQINISFKQPILFQCILVLLQKRTVHFVLRIHLPNNTALGFRPNMGDPNDKIGIHCDSDYNHPDPEINFMLTLSGQKDNNSCFVETAPGSDIFQPLNMEYGEFISFYGNKCRHYNKTNDTGLSFIYFVGRKLFRIN